MANIKIDDLAAYANPASTDVLAIVDVGNDITKKVSIANLFTSVPGNATFAGNVGIGTSNPDFNCHIIGTGTDLLKIQRSGSGGGAKFRMINGDTNYYDFFHDGAEALDIQYNGTSRLKIDSSGRVGIGTSSPARVLDVTSAGSAEIKLTDSTNIGRDMYIKNNDGAFEFRSRDRNSNGTFVFLGYGGETDSERMRIDANGNVFIGGTTAANADIALNANGTATFGSNIDVGGGFGTTDGITLQSNGVIKARGDSLSTTNAGLAIFRGGITSSDITARINFNGSAQFGTYVISGQNPAGGANNGAKLTDDGTVQVSRGSGSNIWAGYTTGTSTATSLITSSGAATFGGDVQSGGDANGGAEDGVRLRSQGIVQASRPSSTNNVWTGYKTGAGTSPTSKITAGGDAEFAGSITGADWDSSGGSGTGYFVGATGGVYVRRDSTASDAATLFGGWKGTNQNFKVAANGTATFAGSVFSGADPASGANTGAEVNPSGVFLASRPSSNTLWYGYTTGSSTATSTIKANGDATFAGAVSKGSGSFRISHPLPAKTETHHLVHSFIEGPQADLIYRGYADLVDGEATVNIDTAARMTEGTFEVLCTNISCFTSNESDWTAVKGSVTGNVLTITAQNATATSKVSWMVVGERKDQHMLDTDWTDNAGRVITEPLKVVDE